MALFRACLDGEVKLVESALVHGKKLVYHWEERYVELTDTPASIWCESSDSVPLLVIKDYHPYGAEDLPHGGTCVPLKKGQVVHGYLDKNEKPKKTKFEGKTFWLGAMEKGTVSWDTALYLPNECVEPLALYKPNWQRMEDNDGRSALHAAAFEGHALICDILIKHGWSCWTKNRMDPPTTPLECARIGGYIDLYYSMVKQQPPPPVPEVNDESDDDGDIESESEGKIDSEDDSEDEEKVDDGGIEKKEEDVL